MSAGLMALHCFETSSAPPAPVAAAMAFAAPAGTLTPAAAAALVAAAAAPRRLRRTLAAPGEQARGSGHQGNAGEVRFRGHGLLLAWSDTSFGSSPAGARNVSVMRLRQREFYSSQVRIDVLGAVAVASERGSVTGQASWRTTGPRRPRRARVGAAGHTCRPAGGDRLARRVARHVAGRTARDHPRPARRARADRRRRPAGHRHGTVGIPTRSRRRGRRPSRRTRHARSRRRCSRKAGTWPPSNWPGRSPSTAATNCCPARTPHGSSRTASPPTRRLRVRVNSSSKQQGNSATTTARSPRPDARSTQRHSTNARIGR